jgi:TPR repeat protein
MTIRSPDFLDGPRNDEEGRNQYASDELAPLVPLTKPFFSWDSSTQLYQGIYYTYCIGCERNPDQAFLCFQRAICTVLSDAPKDSWIRFSVAQYAFARCFEKGFGIVQDQEQAARWYAKVFQSCQEVMRQQDCSKENSDALFLMGLCYEFGRGVEKSADQALELYDQIVKKTQSVNLRAAAEKRAAQLHVSKI